MRITLHRAAVMAALLFLAGCTVLQPVPAPPTAPSENTAVVALLQKSRSQAAAGQWEAASASLERALRIEPRNPVLWQKLARVRLDQGDYPQAENLAAKSNSLAGSDQRLRAENWRIIGQSRSKRGDQAGAKAAFERAEAE
jgi:tetratricopeptide (TPR) repeat protein